MTVPSHLVCVEASSLTAITESEINIGARLYLGRVGPEATNAKKAIQDMLSLPPAQQTVMRGHGDFRGLRLG